MLEEVKPLTAANEGSAASAQGQQPGQPERAEQATTAEGGQPDDLLKRVSAYKPSEAQSSKPEESVFDINEIGKIQDPKAREIAEKAYKSLQSGFTKKFQELAEIRKQFEQRQAEHSNWTPERVQQLLNDQSFVQSAQAVAGINPSEKQAGMTDTEWSALTPQEQAKINEMQKQLHNLQLMNLQAVRTQEDTQLKAKYANYNAQAVDIITNDLLQGKVNATREHLHKVLDYDEAVRRAYELGRQDSKTKTEDKINSMSFSAGAGMNTNPSGVTPEKGESNNSLWNRIIAKNLAAVAGRK